MRAWVWTRAQARESESVWQRDTTVCQVNSPELLICYLKPTNVPFTLRNSGAFNCILLSGNYWQLPIQGSIFESTAWNGHWNFWHKAARINLNRLIFAWPVGEVDVQQISGTFAARKWCVPSWGCRVVFASGALWLIGFQELGSSLCICFASSCECVCLFKCA